MNRQIFELVSFPFEYARRDGTSRDIADLNYPDRDAFELLIRGAQSRLRKIRDDFLITVLEKMVDLLSHDDMRGYLPSISKAGVREFEARAESLLSQRVSGYDELTLAVSTVAALIAETRYAVSSLYQLDHSAFAAAVEAEVASYMSWNAVMETADDRAGSFTAALADFDQEKRSTMATVLAQVEDANRKLVELQQADIETRGRLQKTWSDWDEAQASIGKDISSARSVIDILHKDAERTAATIVATDENLAAFKEAMVEEVRGAETRKLWRDRDRESWAAFAISAALLAVLLLVIPIIGLAELDGVLRTLKRIGDAASEGIPAEATGTQLTVATISRLVVITFPLGLYLWVIRLVVRFNSRSLTLHDDARQRQTMMDTYFILIERQAASSEERALILNALFRPAPGHGPDSVDPPNFTEILGKASGKGE